jgi:glutamine cyclotransferase
VPSAAGLAHHWGIPLLLAVLLAPGVLLAEAPVQKVRVLARYPHDPAAFTQGLAFVDGRLYEGTGGYGESSLREVELATGRVVQRVDLPNRLFGEGITGWKDELIQLTWKAGIGLRYQRDTLREQARFTVVGEGWGLTHDGRQWIMSDGSEMLRFLDAVDGRETGRVAVTDAKRPIRRLNELEYVRGEVWANIWYRDHLVRIDPDSGAVLGYLDLSDLWPHGLPRRSEQVLNGIAYDPDGERLLVTGKRWPWLLEIEVLHPGAN